MFSDVQLKRQILTCFTALGKLSTVTLCLTDLPPLGRRLQNSGEYRFLSVLYSLWLDCPKILLRLFLFKAETSLKLNTMALPVMVFQDQGYKIGLTDMPPLGRRLQNFGEYRFLSVL